RVRMATILIDCSMIVPFWDLWQPGPVGGCCSEGPRSFETIWQGLRKPRWVGRAGMNGVLRRCRSGLPPLLQVAGRPLAVPEGPGPWGFDEASAHGVGDDVAGGAGNIFIATNGAVVVCVGPQWLAARSISSSRGVARSWYASAPSGWLHGAALRVWRLVTDLMRLMRCGNDSLAPSVSRMCMWSGIRTHALT